MTIRVFHPIGQGAFYAERHANYNIVYDCGNWKDTKLADKVVKQSFTEHEIIDILFISHFDADHVNKISVLKDHCNQIRNVVMPLLHENEVQFLLNFYLAIGNTDAVEIFTNPQGFFGEDTNVILVEAGEGIEGGGDGQVVEIEELQGGGEIKISSSTKIKVKAADWFYIPFNYKYKDRNLQLKALFISHGLDIDQFQSDLSYAISNKNKIKKIYDAIAGNINQNSMVLFSGPLDKKIRKIRHYHKRWIFEALGNRPACIYSGDADFNIIDIRVLFSKYWQMVGTVQIPHHGDIKCFNKSFFDGRHYFCPISVGKTNSYAHPSTRVIADIFANNAHPILVTESLDSGFVQVILSK
ncbi:hypothetical protein [Sphingobacterium sp. MYb388]|uniref:hypothetical protein n=1 Tax=Sphingobacterium sp. MYb388 TaxID=2745437 RepID=UPI0030A9F6D9